MKTLPPPSAPLLVVARWLDRLLAQRWLLELLAAGAAWAEAAPSRPRFVPVRCPLARPARFTHSTPSFRQENLPC